MIITSSVVLSCKYELNILTHIEGVRRVMLLKLQVQYFELNFSEKIQGNLTFTIFHKFTRFIQIVFLVTRVIIFLLD